jgi:hypothetical protein
VIALAPLTSSECGAARQVRDETRRDLAHILSAGDADRRVIVELRRFVDLLEAALADYERAGFVRRLRRRPAPAGALPLSEFLRRYSDRFLVMWAVVAPGPAQSL